MTETPDPDSLEPDDPGDDAAEDDNPDIAPPDG